MVKRQMFGRAKLDLLASRFLAAPPPTHAKKIGCTEAKTLAQQLVTNQLLESTDKH
jgi:hypothetical protein